MSNYIYANISKSEKNPKHMWFLKFQVRDSTHIFLLLIMTIILIFIKLTLI
jgi:hypothetical protein